MNKDANKTGRQPRRDTGRQPRQATGRQPNSASAPARQAASTEQRAGKLVVCPTPLGNLGDMPPRALAALRAADVVCCEDTRVTGKLLAALGVEGKRLERLDEATIRMPVNRAFATPVSASDGAATTGGAAAAGQTATAGEAVVQRAAGGEVVAYCTDAGMPGVSDPGQYLVACARSAGVPVEVLPGPTAVATAYVASGFACPRFYFGGFFPRKEGERAKALDLVKTLDAVAIFYESPHRLVAALQAIAHVLPTRQVAVCRELTKLHEEVYVGQAPAVLDEFAARADIKGEVVLVIDVADASEADHDARTVLDRAAQAAAQLRAEGALSKKDIVARLQADFGLSRNAAYDLVHGA